MKSRFIQVLLLSLSTAMLLSCGGGGSSGVAGLGQAGAANGGAVASGSDLGGDASGASSSSVGGSTTTASSGDDSGVGSGGTGVSTADATGIGSVDGFGSIFVNGLRYDTDSAALSLQDADTLQIGMTVKVTGPVSTDFTSGVAKTIASAAELRGTVSSIDSAAGSFFVLGTLVTVDTATVWSDLSGFADLMPGIAVQVWGLPDTAGVLRATRVARQAAATSPIVTGVVRNLDASTASFKLGGLTVRYASAAFLAGLDAGTLADGVFVRVRAAAGSGASGVLDASSVQRWNAVPQTNGSVAQLAGVITDYAALGSFKLLGTTVDASAAQITGGPAESIGNGVKVDVAGILVNGTLVATKLRIRYVPGTGGPVSFFVVGTVGSYVSAANFIVRGQPVDASAPNVVFNGGTAANLRNGAKVTVSGSQVVNGTLMADSVSFD